VEIILTSQSEVQRKFSSQTIDQHSSTTITNQTKSEKLEPKV